MPTPSGHKTIQARILSYAEAIGWMIVSREEAEGFPTRQADRRVRPPLSHFFDDLLDTKVREFVENLCNRCKFLDYQKNREYRLILVGKQRSLRGTLSGAL